jgi:hypothetical protein
VAVENLGVPCPRPGPWDELVASSVAQRTAPLADIGYEVGPLFHEIEVPPSDFHFFVSSSEQCLWMDTTSGLGVSMPPYEDLDGILFPIDSGPANDCPLNLEKEPEQWS